jgi:hypothetical protein
MSCRVPLKGGGGGVLLLLVRPCMFLQVKNKQSELTHILDFSSRTYLNITHYVGGTVSVLIFSELCLFFKVVKFLFLNDISIRLLANQCSQVWHNYKLCCEELQIRLQSFAKLNIIFPDSRSSQSCQQRSLPRKAKWELFNRIGVLLTTCWCLSIRAT